MSDSLGKLPDDVENLLKAADLESTLRREALMHMLRERAARWSIRIEELSAPITLCQGRPHKVIDVILPEEHLDEWLEHIGSPLKVYRVFRNERGDLLIKVCECTGPPHPLVYLAREGS
jgi:hypothetical protein